MKYYKLITLIAASVLFLVACHDDTDEVELTKAYLGTLTLEYSRSFPSFSNTVTIDIEISKSGEVTIVQPDLLTYDAIDEVAATVKIREKGSIAVNSMSGKVDFTKNEEFVVINARSLIIGDMTVWGWDDEMGWIFIQTIPVEISNPVESPMSFSIKESAMTGDDIGAKVAGYMGDMTFNWTLLLVPKLTE